VSGNLFTRQPLAPASSVGATLAAARRQGNRSLADVALSLGVPARVLQAIEDDDFARLPGLVYEQRLVRRYALALGLAAGPLVAEWAAARHEAIDPAAAFVRRLSWRDVRISPLVWRRVAATLAVAVVGVYLGGRFLAMVRPPALTVVTPAVALSTTSRVVTVAGSVEPGVNVAVNGQPVATAADGTFATSVTLAVGTNTVRVSAARRYGRPATVERQVFVAVPPLGT
jgi:hypothetical protein